MHMMRKGYASPAAWICCLFAWLLAVLPGAGALDPARPPAENFDLSRWYLGTPAQPQSTQISAAELLVGFTNSWFYTGTNGAMVFWCPVNGGTTAGSTYPRSELREQINPPDNSVNWTAFGTHTLDARCKVTQMPSTGKICIGQIHSYLGNANPLIKLVFDNGRIDAQVKESPTASTDLHYYFPNVPFNSLITYRIELRDGILTMTVNGVTKSVDTFNNDPEWAGQTFYFKAGSYVQDNSGTSAEGGRVEFYQLSTSHTNSPPALPVITRPPASQSAPVSSNAVLNLSVVGGLPLSYQWYKEGVVLPGATNSILPIYNVLPDHEGNYHAVASNTAGRVTSAAATLTVISGNPAVSLAEGLDTTNLVWTATDSLPWEGCYGVAHDGLDQACSGRIGDGATTSMETTVAGPGSVSFWWKVDSQPNDDYLIFYVGSSEQARISGLVDWQPGSFTVPSGTQVLRWTYSKGGALAASSDRGWVDEVRFGPQPVTITAHPTNRVVDAGTTVTFNVTATGTLPLTHRWHRDGTPLADGPGVRGAGTNSLVLSNVPVSLAGTYSVVVSNAAGAVTSSNALLVVTPFISLAEALDGANLVWTTNGTPPWVGQDVVTRDGTDAAHSGAIGNSTTTYMQSTVNGPGTVTFWWKASSQTNSDALIFYVGSTERARISGEADWRRTNFSIAAGSQVLRWTYSKNGSTAVGLDRAWVDQVSYERLPSPLVPGNLAASPVSISRIDLAWIDTSTNETAFLVERSTNNGTTFTQIAALGSNVTAYANTGLLASTTYHYRVRSTNAAGASAYTAPLAASTLAFTAARINFQPASAPVPAGYLVDGGAAFGTRGNGLQYGWNSSRTSSATDRNSSLSPDQRYDTFVATSTSSSTRWELGLPNGLYNVLVVVGNASVSSGTYKVGVEGAVVVNGVASTSNRWVMGRANVTVADGRLTLTNVPGASSTPLCFIDVVKFVPLLTCPSNKTVECGSLWVFNPPAVANDPCGGSNIALVVVGTLTNEAGACGFTATRTWRAVDGCGNTNTCSQTVTVVDTSSPVLTCAPDQTLEWVTNAVPTFDSATASDNCDTNPAVTFADAELPATCPAVRVFRRTWTATDACSNSASCSQTLTFVDTNAPSASGPADQSALAGSDMLLATAVTATNPLTYVWRFNGELISGATSAGFILENVSSADTGRYCVEITGPCNSVTNCAMLTILDPQTGLCSLTQGFYASTNGLFDSLPAGTLLTNLFSAAGIVIGKADARSVTIDIADVETFTALLPAGGPATQLPEPGGQTLTSLPLNPKGKLNNALLGQILTLALNCRLEPGLTSVVPARFICTRGTDGVRSFGLPASVLESLTNTASGLNDPTVAGLLELANRGLAGSLGEGATLAEIHQAVEAVNAAFDGCRTLVTCSPLATLAPANDRFAARTAMSGSVTASGRNVTATTDPGEPPHATLAAGKSVWWQWTPSRSGTVRIRTSGSSFDTVLAVYVGGTVEDLTSVAANDDSGGVWSEVVFEATAGTAYQIAVDGYSDNCGNIVLMIVEDPAP